MADNDEGFHAQVPPPKDSKKIVKRTWTEEEDRRLLDLVEQHGTKEWYVEEHVLILKLSRG
jgi:hypothetical protein